MTAAPVTAAPEVEEGPVGAADWVLVVLLCLLSAVLGVFGVFFLPTYVGSVPVPAVVVVTTAALVMMPRVGYRLTRQMGAAMAPVVIWFVVCIGLYLVSNALYRGVLVAWRGWQFYLLIGLGAIAAATSLGLLWSEQFEQKLDARVGPDPRRPR